MKIELECTYNHNFDDYYIPQIEEYEVKIWRNEYCNPYYYVELEEEQVKDFIWYMYKKFGDIIIYKDSYVEGCDMRICIYDGYVE